MKWFLLSFLIFLPAFSGSAKGQSSEKKFHICFFELDNTVTSKNFKRRIKSSKDSIDLCKKKQEFKSANTVVHCYQPDGETGAKAFERMIDEVTKAGGRCDGLVMSGHHTGDWSGRMGEIGLKDMEELSCLPEYRDWFSNIKALWLDGCTTVTDDLIQSDKPLPINTADARTARVVHREYKGNKINQINEGIIAGTSQAYTASLDKNTPLSSRYLRMFPDTQIYGFNGASPAGWDRGQHSFIVTQLSQLGLALLAEEGQTENITQTDKIKKALSVISNDPCNEKSMETWKEIDSDWSLKKDAIKNQNYNKAYRLGCDLTLAKRLLDDSSSKENQKALAEHIKNLQGTEDFKNKESLLDLANKILDAPKKDNQEEAVELAKALVLNTLDEITTLDQETGTVKNYTHLLFNNIYDTWKTAQKYQTDDKEFYKETQKRLQEDNFKSSVRERIESSRTASLRKGDYIKFYMEVNNLNLSDLSEDHPFISKGINDLVHKAGGIFENLKDHKINDEPLAEDSRRALAVSVVDQLFQYDLLTEDQINTLISNRGLFPKKSSNPFYIKVQAKIALSGSTQEQQVRQLFTEGDKRSPIRQPVLSALSEKYLQNPSNNLKALQEVAASMDLNDTGGDVLTFFNAIQARFRAYTQKQKEDFIVKYAKESNKNLEELSLWYAKINFDEKNKKAICQRLKDSRQVAAKNLRYVCET